MSAIYIVCFLALTVGIVLVLGLTPEQLTRDLAGLFQRRKSLREQSLNARGKKKRLSEHEKKPKNPTG